MRFVRLLSIITLLTTFTAIVSFGQEVHILKSTEKVRIDGYVYYVHNVRKGETVYSLTRAYGVSEDELKRINPQLAGGLKEGQVIRIPEKPSQAEVQQTANRPSSGTIEHEVQRKETLFSISRQYSVSVDEIKKANPTIDDNIKKGQILYIPTPANVQTESQPQHATVPIRHKKEGDDMVGEHVYHSVKKSETLYSIAKEYSTSEDVIKSLNPDAFKDGSLMEGAVLRIPKYEAEDLGPDVKILFPGYTYQTDDTPAPINTYRYSSTNVFNVVFLLPLSISGGAEDDTSWSESSATGEKKQNQYLRFYEGALLAIDSLKRMGLSLNISTLDVADSRSLDAALQNSNVQQAHIIVAPIQGKLVEHLANFAQQRQIPTILPISKLSDSVMAYNPYLIQLRLSSLTTEYRLLDSICQPNRNIVLVNHAGGDTTLFHTYSTLLKEKGCTYSTLSYTIFRSRANLEATLNPTKENHVIIAASTDQSLVIDVLERLSLIHTKKKIKLHIYGSPEWRRLSMNNIQVKYLYDLNLHLSQPFYIDYSNDKTKEFISKYRHYYKGEPGNYSFYGYDVCFYFLDCLQTYGSNFIPFLPHHEKNMLQSRFKLKQVGYGGMKNEGVFLLEYQPDLTIISK